ncbi:MAG: DUF2510 domain-containing protein [Promicromonosporaceae bacterium]|nr:DUF2510 domain-containing protein [Promicromonosporaceae bacterium]
MTHSATPPGFYPNPDGSPTLRWWDGQAWAQQVQPLPQPPAAQPIPAPETPPVPVVQAPAAPPPATPLATPPVDPPQPTPAPAPVPLADLPQPAAAPYQASPEYAVPPAVTPAAPKKPASKGLIAGIAGAFLAVAAIVVVLVVFVFGGNDDGEPDEGTSLAGTQAELLLTAQIVGSWAYDGTEWFVFEAGGTGTAGGQAMTWGISGDILTLSSVAGDFTWLTNAADSLEAQVEIDGDTMTHTWIGHGHGVHVYHRISPDLAQPADPEDGERDTAGDQDGDDQGDNRPPASAGEGALSDVTVTDIEAVVTVLGSSHVLMNAHNPHDCVLIADGFGEGLGIHADVNFYDASGMRLDSNWTNAGVLMPGDNYIYALFVDLGDTTPVTAQLIDRWDEVTCVDPATVPSFTVENTNWSQERFTASVTAEIRPDSGEPGMAIYFIIARDANGRLIEISSSFGGIEVPAGGYRISESIWAEDIDTVEIVWRAG